MSLEDCNKKIKFLSSQHSFSSGKDIINDNFASLKGCLTFLQEEVANGAIGTSTPFPIIFPTSPNANIEYNLVYSATSENWFLTQDLGDAAIGGGSLYHLLDGQELLIKERHQHIVLQEIIQDGNSNINIQASGELVIL